MNPQDQYKPSTETNQVEKQVAPSYVPPRLQRLGDIRDVTFGPSPGTTDSGGQGAEPGLFAGPGGW